MIIKDILKEMGINKSDVAEILYLSNKRTLIERSIEADVENKFEIDMDINKGFEIRVLDIRTNEKLQVIKIHPNVDWTDGTCRPTWMDGYASIYLKKRYDENEILRKTYKSRMGNNKIFAI